MGNIKDANVLDSETKVELLEIKSDLHDTIKSSITAEFKGLREHLSELFNKDIERIDKTLDQFRSNHIEHYDDDKERRLETAKNREITDKKIAEVKETFEAKISLVREELIREVTTHKTKDKEKEMTKGNIILICTIITVVVAIVALQF